MVSFDISTLEFTPEQRKSLAEQVSTGKRGQITIPLQDPADIALRKRQLKQSEIYSRSAKLDYAERIGRYVKVILVTLGGLFLLFGGFTSIIALFTWLTWYWWLIIVGLGVLVYKKWAGD